MWFNGSHTKVQRHFLTNAFCYLRTYITCTKIRNRPRLIAVCKVIFNKRAAVFYQPFKTTRGVARVVLDLIKHALRVYWTASKTSLGTIDTKISKELNMYTNYAKLWRNYHIYGINLRCGLRSTDFSAWLYDIYDRTTASKRKFREVKSGEEENLFDNAIPTSTRWLCN